MKCYLCLKEITDMEYKSNDHVPPQNIYPKPKPSNLITITSHLKCNQEYSQDEEMFRSDIVVMSDIVKNSSAKHIWEKVKRSHTYNPSKLTDMTSRIVLTKGNQRLLKLPKERTERVIIKIAKGLLYYHRGIYVDEDCRISVYFQPVEIVPDLLAKAQHKGRHENIFSYAGAVSNSGSIWWMVFYGQIAAIVSFWNEKLENDISS